MHRRRNWTTAGNATCLLKPRVRSLFYLFFFCCILLKTVLTATSIRTVWSREHGTKYFNEQIFSTVISWRACRHWDQSHRHQKRWSRDGQLEEHGVLEACVNNPVKTHTSFVLLITINTIVQHICTQFLQKQFKLTYNKANKQYCKTLNFCVHLICEFHD